MAQIIPHAGNLCSRYATKMLSIKINHRCNRNCSFCVDRGGRSGEDVNVESMVKEAISRPDYQTVIITGGEPFLNFSEVVQLAKELRPVKQRIVLNTNGSLLTAEKVAALNGLIDELQVSIHHYDEVTNGSVLGGVVPFDGIRQAIAGKEFEVSINSTFNNSYATKDMTRAVEKLVVLVKYLGADNLRLTELKKVDEDVFVSADKFFGKNKHGAGQKTTKLITTGCTHSYISNGINVSVKRLCEYAKGVNATAFSCCFIDAAGQKKIDVDTEDTFKVIYSDGLVTNDWVFSGL